MTRMSTWLVIPAILVGLSIGGGAASAAVASAGGHSHEGLGRPVPGVSSIRPRRAQTAPSPCFFTFPDCSSPDPSVAFAMDSSNDTTGCTFQQVTDWGDGDTTTLTYKGGAAGSLLTIFQHTYAAPGTFEISWTIDVVVQSGSCGGGNGGLGFTLLAPPPVLCQSASVTLPAVSAPVAIPSQPVSVGYGALPLALSVIPSGTGSLCSMRSGLTSLPVDLIVPQAAPIEIGQSRTTTTIDFLPASDPATQVPACDFTALEALASPGTSPPVKDFAATSDCLLTPTYHASWDVIARWSIPGFSQFALVPGTDSYVRTYTTEPLTYYVDLDTIPDAPSSTAPFQDALQSLAAFVDATLVQNLPPFDRIGLIQDSSSDRLLVTDPLERRAGVGGSGKASSFPGAGFARAGGRFVVWILEPLAGSYHVIVTGRSEAAFRADFTSVQFLGHGTVPLIKDTVSKGVLGPGGGAKSAFSVGGLSLRPVLRTQESLTKVTQSGQVRFGLGGSVIPFGIAKVTWSFGDGTRAIGKTATHRYDEAGRFVPAVTVTDVLGDTVTVALKAITVQS